MLLLRLLAVLGLVAMAASLAAYAYTRNPRYLRFAWRVFFSVLAFALALAVFYGAERFLFIL